MDYVKVEPGNANKVKSLMVRFKLLDTSRQVNHSRSYVYFPIINSEAKSKKLLERMGAEIVSRKEQKKDDDSYMGRLRRIINKNELSKLSEGYDQLGEIAIIEFEGSRANERKIAKTLIDTNSSIRTVLAKAGAVRGKYRVRKLRYVAGKRNFIATYRENNCRFRFDTRKVFFSNRLSFERSRILDLIKGKENIMVMFAGVGPFAIEIAKTYPKTKVIGIELNKDACKYMKENIILNKTPNAVAVNGDVKKLSTKYKNSADRIIMPLPKSSMEFLDDAYKVARKKAVVHLYVFTDNLEDIYNKIKAHAKENDYKVKFLNEREVRPYSKFECEYAIDYLIKK